jgi:DNA-binding MarR family transcriptional regulator
MCVSNTPMPADPLAKPEECNCLTVRQVARHVSQFYDRFLAIVGLHTTQFSIPAKLQRLGPLTINALAAEMVMDRTTLGRTIQPLVRQGLVAIVRGLTDRRRKELQLTDVGADRLREAVKLWIRAQDRFVEIFGSERTAELRALMHAVSASELV